MDRFLNYIDHEVGFRREVDNFLDQLSKVDDPKSLTCQLRLDMIVILDQDIQLWQYIQTKYPELEGLCRIYIYKRMSSDCSIRQLHPEIKKEHINIQIDMINCHLQSDLSVYAQQRILSMMVQGAGELVEIDNFQVIGISQLESYLKYREFTTSCFCHQQENKRLNYNLIQHVLHSKMNTNCNFNGILSPPQCEECQAPMAEMKDRGQQQMCKRIVVYIPNMKQHSSRGVYEMYLENAQVGQIKVNTAYSAIAYHALNYKLAPSSNQFLLDTYTQLHVEQHLFALSLSTRSKQKNYDFQMHQITLTSQFYQLTQDEDPNHAHFHFAFKQLIFAVDAIYSNKHFRGSNKGIVYIEKREEETCFSRFGCLQLKVALVMSYVLNNAKSLLQESEGTKMCDLNEFMHVLIECEEAFSEKICKLVESTYCGLSDFVVFDGLSFGQDFSSALISGCRGIVMIKNLQDMSKTDLDTLEKVLQGQDITLKQIKTKVQLSCTIWAFSTPKDILIKKTKGIGRSLEDLFDIVLTLDRSSASMKDYKNLLGEFVSQYLQTELNHEKTKNNLTVEKEKDILSPASVGSTAKKLKQREERFSDGRREYSTLKVNRYPRDQLIKQQQVLLEQEENAFEMINGLINAARERVKHKMNIGYSIGNVTSITKFATACALFLNVFVKETTPQDFLLSCGKMDSSDSFRIGIDMFDAFMAIFFNILSRKTFSQDIDTPYLHSFIINYAHGYTNNPNLIIPSEEEFFRAFEKIQDLIVDYIDTN